MTKQEYNSASQDFENRFQAAVNNPEEQQKIWQEYNDWLQKPEVQDAQNGKFGISESGENFLAAYKKLAHALAEGAIESTTAPAGWYEYDPSTFNDDQKAIYDYYKGRGLDDEQAAWYAQNADYGKTSKGIFGTAAPSGSTRIGDNIFITEDNAKKMIADYDSAKSAAIQNWQTPTITATDKDERANIAENNAIPKEQGSSDIQQAMADSAQAAQKEATEQARINASAGINKSRAGMLSDNQTQQSQTNNIANNYNASQAQHASTQADYLQKMAQADALDQQAANMKKGLNYTTAAGAIQGATTGASTGLSMGLASDERLKESYDDKLEDAIKQFRILYKRVKAIRG